MQKINTISMVAWLYIHPRKNMNITSVGKVCSDVCNYFLPILILYSKYCGNEGYWLLYSKEES